MCDKAVCERWCALQRKMVRVTVVCEREVVTKLCEKCAKKAQRTVLRLTRPCPALLHEASERHHCAMQSALQQTPHARVNRSDQSSETVLHMTRQTIS